MNLCIGHYIRQNRTKPRSRGDEPEFAAHGEDLIHKTPLTRG